MAKSVKINLIYNITYQILIIVLPLITSPYLSRTLGAEGTGVYSYTYSVAYYFVMFAMLGVNNYGNRCVARVRDDKTRLSKEFWSIYSLQAAMSLVFAIAYIFYSLLAIGNVTIAVAWLPYVLSAGLDVNWFFSGSRSLGRQSRGISW